MSAQGARAKRDVLEWSAAARDALARRDDAIARMVAAGGSLREVAAAAGMTHTAVRRLVQRRDDNGGNDA